MKNHFVWLLVLTFIFSGVYTSRAAPGAGMAYMCALMNYNIGMKQMQSNPRAAVESFERAEQWIQRVNVDGITGTRVNQLNHLIGHALILAEMKQKNSPVNTVKNSPRKINVRPLIRIGSPVVKKAV